MVIDLNKNKTLQDLQLANEDLFLNFTLTLTCLSLLGK